MAELPECTAASPSQIEALTTVETEAMRRIAAMHAAGIPAPIPLTERRYSGKILLRIPPELHRELSIAAATQHISLNRLIANRLAGGAADEETSDNQSDVLPRSHIADRTVRIHHSHSGIRLPCDRTIARWQDITPNRARIQSHPPAMQPRNRTADR